MATLALSAAGSMLGGALLPGGISLLGASLSGAALGQAVGAMAGRYVDQALFGSSGQSRQVEGSRLSDLQVVSSSEGAIIPRLYGRARMAGQVIWATQLEEEIIKTSQSAGSGKGRGPSVTTTQYNYYANFAIGLCEGEISRIGTIWADGKIVSLKDVTYRLYKGDESQQPDSLIAAKEGAENAPAYRGLAYIVFEHMALEAFGNRIPQLNFEVFRPVDDFEKNIKAVTVLPGSGEFVYNTTEVMRSDSGANQVSENLHTNNGGSDWSVSIDDLESSLPNVKAASLVVSWFGNDLRAGNCTVQPMIDNAIKQTQPLQWSVAGLSRGQAQRVSLFEDAPAYGGTPSDKGVIEALADLRQRGIKAVFNPFILMDIPTDNSLSDPYGNTAQGAYPWRGLITCDPAPMQTGTTDKTAFSSIQIDHFIGTAAIDDFSIVNDTVVYNGAQEWSYRRMILHYAWLCKMAGGVYAFLLGSELRGLTTIRDENNHFPFVDALIALAADVRSILGAETKITYGADWSEYFGYHPADNSKDVWFHLDPLWASPAIDAIGIDCYWPLSDWREGEGHLDKVAKADRSIYDLEYLTGNMAGGEGYDWYYASSLDRDQQNRSLITDGLGKPWVYRYKDIKNWWQNQHYNRIGGVEQSSPTPWTPQSKPFWFTEVGCGAIDKGANQPNIFADPKSVQSGLPYFSNGERDDYMQRSYIQAFYSRFDRNDAGYQSGANPISTLTGLPMVEQNFIFVYSWDARPYPAFPYDGASWGDGDNWQTGHWLNGRVGDAPLEEVVQAICQDYEIEDRQTQGLTGLLSGLVVTNLQSARSVLQPLELAFFFDSFESGKTIMFRHRGVQDTQKNITVDQLVEVKPESDLYRIVRAQETELPKVARISYIDNGFSYQLAVAQSRRLAGGSDHVAAATLPLIMHPKQVSALAQSWLAESWSAREKVSFSLPPSMLGLEPSDNLTLSLGNQSRQLRITELTNQHSLEVSAQSHDSSVFEDIEGEDRAEVWVPPTIFGKTRSFFMDLPLLHENDNPAACYLAAFQSPWPGKVAYYRSAEQSGYELDSLITAPATMGTLVQSLDKGFSHRRDFSASITLKLDYGQLHSISDIALFGGGNSAALHHGDDQWEIIQFQNVDLVGDGVYELSSLLRGQRGTEQLAKKGIEQGGRFVLLDEAVIQASLSLEHRGLPLNWKYGPASQNIGSSSFSEDVYAASAIGLRPFAPVHGSMSPLADGDYKLTWIRRSRYGGDSWEGSDIILSEDRERYEIDIIKENEVVRTLETSTSEVVYTQADVLSDFGNLTGAIEARVYQMSAIYGRGLPLHISSNG